MSCTSALYPVLFLVLCAPSLHGVTFVYNLRIGETTRTRNTAFGELKPSVVAVTPLAQFRGFENHFHQSAGGVLGNYIYAEDSWYARVNVAVGRVHADGCNIDQFGATEVDDILFTGGCSWQAAEKIRITASAHLGLPTHRNYLGDPVQLGTGHVGGGLQLDGLYTLNEKDALLLALRAIYFIPRNGTLIRNEQKTCLPHFRLGNLVDFLISYQHSFGNNRYMASIGYNPNFTFGTDDPNDPFGVHTLHTTQNTFFATYRYAFPIKKCLSAIIVGASCGILSVPAPLNKGYNVTTWLTWGINF